MRLARILMTMASLGFAATAVGDTAHPPIEWRPWSADLFQTATAQKRLVVLDLEAVWCHWCHVMAASTYGDPKVAALIRAHYLPVRADQDAAPDLSARYGDWGWPATIIFGPDGTEIAKLRGYIEPDRFAALLQAIIDDPTPGPSATAFDAVVPAPNAFLSAKEREALTQTFDAAYDKDHGGWGGRQRFIDADSLDYDVARAEQGDGVAAAQARQTLDAAIALIDPVWGGVYQYSDNGDWTSPHYEKIMSYQAQYLRQYSEAYARWRDPRYLRAAQSIASYLTGMLLGSDGGFYTSQDADLDQTTTGHVYYALDDAGRRQRGMPRIDRHQYARENGWAITGLLALYDASGDAVTLATAARAGHWVIANRSRPDGAFRHDARDRSGPYLEDTLAMGQAFLHLYAATGDRSWLQQAMAAGDAIGRLFKDPAGGFRANGAPEAAARTFAEAPKPLDDQIAIARFMNRLARYSGRPADRAQAEHAMRYAVSAAIDPDRPLPGLLLADLELNSAPVHVTVVGRKDDPAARALAAIARALPATYKRLDWWDQREGPLPNPDVTYPDLGRAAAFACGNRTCSLPAFTADELARAVAAMAKRETRTAPRPAAGLN